MINHLETLIFCEKSTYREISLMCILYDVHNLKKSESLYKRDNESQNIERESMHETPSTCKQKKNSRSQTRESILNAVAQSIKCHFFIG